MSKYEETDKKEQEECCVGPCSCIESVACYAGEVAQEAFEVRALMESRTNRVLGALPESNCCEEEARREPECDMEVIRTALANIHDCLSQIRSNACRL